MGQRLAKGRILGLAAGPRKPAPHANLHVPDNWNSEAPRLGMHFSRLY